MSSLRRLLSISLGLLIAVVRFLCWAALAAWATYQVVPQVEFTSSATAPSPCRAA